METEQEQWQRWCWLYLYLFIGGWSLSQRPYYVTRGCRAWERYSQSYALFLFTIEILYLRQTYSVSELSS